MSKKICCDCGKAVKKDEIALAKKLIDEDTEEFYCLPCMAEYEFLVKTECIITKPRSTLQ